MKKEFVIRGQTASNGTEILNFSGYKPGYAYRLVEFELYPSTGIGIASNELCGTITAGKVGIDPANPNFNDEGLIGTAITTQYYASAYPTGFRHIVNDTFLITQNLILMVKDTDPSAGTPVNWQCRFVAEKVNTAEGAVANYKQFTISDG